MKLATDKSHRDYFYKNGTIEFESLISTEQVQELNEGINRVLSKSLSLSKDKIERRESKDLFLQGRDLFRKDEKIKKIVLNRHLAEIAVELMEVRSLRIGYDQLLIGKMYSPIRVEKTANPYEDYLNNSGSLQDKSCLTPLICGLILCLEPAHSIEIPPSFLPKSAGSGVFFKPELSFDLSFLNHAEGGRYLLITYADPRTVYILNDQDPLTHAYKHLGHVFGDRINDKFNPLVYKV